MTTRTTEHEFLAKIKAVGLTRGEAILDHLWGLYLTGTNITDGGLAHLKRLANLRDLALFDTHVTDGGIADLRKTLPKLAISR